MSPEEKLLRAIFGPAPSAEETAALEAERRADDWREAERIAASVRAELGDGWQAALFWGNPAAIRVVGTQAEMAVRYGSEWAWTKLSAMDADNTEIRA